MPSMFGYKNLVSSRHPRDKTNYDHPQPSLKRLRRLGLIASHRRHRTLVPTCRFLYVEKPCDPTASA